MHRVFISYHHANDQDYKEALVGIGDGIFEDGSVDIGDISDELSDQEIREKIRDEYLRDTSVTVVLVGLETKRRKHVDWEIYSSMFDGKKNKKSGILVVNLPPTGCYHFTARHDGENNAVYPDCTNWFSIDERSKYEERYPHLPDRIIDNLLHDKAKVSVTGWARITDHPDRLRFLIDAAYADRETCEYDLARPMKRRDS